MNGMMKINAIITEYINYAMQRNYIPVIRQLLLHNNSQAPLTGIKIKITSSPEFLHEYTVMIDNIPAGGSLQLDEVKPVISAEYLLSLTERMEGVIIIEAFDKEGSNIEKVYYPIYMLAFDEWSGFGFMPELLTSFITPNHPEITGLIVKAGEILRKWGKDSKFTAYQSNNPNTVRLFMAAIYKAVQNESISYCVPPASFEDAGQRVRLVDDIMRNKMATCLDITLLYAGCLEAIGLNPIIVLLEGHAFAACWLDNECFSEILQDDVSLLTKRFADGINEICVVECTSMTESSVSFDDACVRAQKQLLEEEKFRFFIDVCRARSGAIRPLPLRSTDENGKLIIKEYKAQVEVSDDAGAMPQNLADYGKISEVEKVEVSRKTIWERKLLDLSLRNMLVSFRTTKSSLQIISPDLAELENALCSGSDFRIMPRAKDWEKSPRDNNFYFVENSEDVVYKLVREEFLNKRLRCFIDEVELNDTIKNIYRKSKVSIEENGTNTLYLALGFLRWYESDVSERARYAPLILIPIDIVRKSAQAGYVIRMRDDEPQMNITLLEMMRQDFGIVSSGFDPLPQDESGVDINAVFTAMRQLVKSKSRWDIEEIAFIGLFSFNQFIMWNDIRNRSDELENNKLVSSLMAGSLKWNEEEFYSPEYIDKEVSPDKIALPISCDSSQLSAVCAAGEGKSFVLHGPPGTGKSQTITNIIANSLFKGQSVLFVAEKMAALEVVQRRLSAIGIGNFCLELHSNKAKKKSVLSQLEEALQTPKVASSEEYAVYSNRISSLRSELNEFAEAMHKTREYGFSLYNVMSRCTLCGNNVPIIGGMEELILLLNTENLLIWKDILREIIVADRECGGISGNPLSAFKSLEYTPSLRNKLQEILDNYTELIGKQLSMVDKIRTELGIERFESAQKLIKFTEICEVLIKSQDIPLKLFMHEDIESLEKIVKSACEKGDLRDKLRGEILSNFNESVFSINIESVVAEQKEAAQSWFLVKSIKRGKLKKLLSSHSKNPSGFKKSDIDLTIAKLLQYNEYSLTIREYGRVLSPLYEESWGIGTSDWEKIKLNYEQVSILRNSISALVSPSERSEYISKFAKAVIDDLEGFRNCCGESIREFAESSAGALKLEQSLAELVGIDFEKLRLDDKYISKIMTVSCAWRDSLNGIRSWSIWLGIRSKAIDAGLENVILAMESGKIAYTELEKSFMYSLFRGCAEKTISEESVLSQFSGMLFEDKIEKFREITLEYEKLTRDEIFSRLVSRVPNPSQNIAASSEISILQRAIKSGGRALSIRKLFESIPQLLRRLCPCMLMSPISVAQYIDPSFEQFDLVIFDEASQLPTSSAVGAIARGRNVIVVGDPKQLPPTSFFSTNSFDEDNYDKEDLESILDDCLALSMPSEHLLWHYRSRHESLIAFSNMQFYENRLYTFPSPNDLISGVKFIPVEGYYDRGRSKQNRAEAEQIVAEIIRRLRDDNLRRQSIGVVTFSVVQQNLIDDLLMEAFVQNPELEEINNAADEPIFIKNLENVQGDERDIIMFSVGYAPDKDGKLTLNFGPLNRDGGWRRLNVAVSRARIEMLVYSVLRPEQIDLSKTLAQGVAGLKAFLEFARYGKKALPERQYSLESREHTLTSGVEREIAARIASLGYQVKIDIGSSKYKIDIGILNPKDPEEYILGILLDGKSYIAAKTARDRNIAQISVLESLGWSICRIWLLDWWESPDKVMDKIKKAIDDAGVRKTLPKSEVKSIPPKPKAAKADVKTKLAAPPIVKGQSSGGSIYKITQLENQEGGSNKFYDESSDEIIMSQINDIVMTEAPISRSLFRKRLLSAWGLTRITAKLDARIEELTQKCGVVVTGSGSSIFLWHRSSDPSEYKDFRKPASTSERRGIEDVPVQETANAVLYVLNEQLSMKRSDLVKQVYRIYGFTRTSEYIEQSVNDAVGLLIEGDRIKLEDDKVSL